MFSSSTEKFQILFGALLQRNPLGFVGKFAGFEGLAGTAAGQIVEVEAVFFFTPAGGFARRRRLARGLKPPSFRRLLFQSAV